MVHHQNIPMCTYAQNSKVTFWWTYLMSTPCTQGDVLMLGLWHFGALPWCWRVMVGDLMAMIHTGWLLNLGCVTFNGGLPRCWQVIQCDFHIVGFVTGGAFPFDVAYSHSCTHKWGHSNGFHWSGVVCSGDSLRATPALRNMEHDRGIMADICCEYLCSEPYLFTYTCLLVRSLYGIWAILSCYQ